MSISEKFRNFEGQDKQIKALDSAKRNFEVDGYGGNARLIINLGYFEILKELLHLFPGAEVEHDRHGGGSIPGLRWHFREGGGSFKYLKAGYYYTQGDSSPTLHVSTSDFVSTPTDRGTIQRASEKIPKDKLNKDTLEEAIFSVMVQNGFQVGSKK